MRRRSVGWTASAQADLDQAIAYIAEDSRAGAESVLESILAAARALSSFPERGRVMPELGLDDIREVFVFNFRIVYQLGKDEIRIVAILHGARDLRGWRPPRSG